MDTSKEYIEMCQKAGEIQSIWGNRKYLNRCVFNRNWFDTSNEIYIWLPRQDQLQDMVEAHLSIKSNYNHILYHLIAWLDKFPRGEYLKYLQYSMEQLWLAFVMHEKFNKKWDGEEWI